jgi:hypothetical protein
MVGDATAYGSTSRRGFELGNDVPRYMCLRSAATRHSTAARANTRLVSVSRGEHEPAGHTGSGPSDATRPKSVVTRPGECSVTTIFFVATSA